MKLKIWKEKQLKDIKFNIPSDVYYKILKGIQILNENYGEDRDVDNDDGGYYILYIEPTNEEYIEIYERIDSDIHEDKYLICGDGKAEWIEDFYLVNNETSINLIYPEYYDQNFKIFFGYDNFILGIFNYLKDYKLFINKLPIKNVDIETNRLIKEYLTLSLDIFKDEKIRFYDTKVRQHKEFKYNQKAILTFLSEFLNNSRITISKEEVKEKFPSILDENLKRIFDKVDIVLMPIYMEKTDIVIFSIIICNQYNNKENNKPSFIVYDYGLNFVRYLSNRSFSIFGHYFGEI